MLLAFVCLKADLELVTILLSAGIAGKHGHTQLSGSVLVSLFNKGGHCLQMLPFPAYGHMLVYMVHVMVCVWRSEDRLRYWSSLFTCLRKSLTSTVG